eukprot:4885606-Karenia_brevis.AAC.1
MVMVMIVIIMIMLACLLEGSSSLLILPRPQNRACYSYVDEIASQIFPVANRNRDAHMHAHPVH